MSERASRRLRPKDVAMLVKSGGDFTEETRFVPTAGGGFVPWGKSTFKAVNPGDVTNSNEPSDSLETNDTGAEITESAATPPADASVSVEEAPVTDQVPEAVAAIATPPVNDTPFSSADIVAEIEKAREDGRALGYQQGVTAARQEFEGALTTLRRLEESLLPLADEAVARNTEIIARHVRRIAQDLAGMMLSTIPEDFVARIHRAAETFTRANMEYTLTINSHDAAFLIPALKGDELFASIRVIEDAALPAGGFKLSARDLEVEDYPELLGAGDDA